MFDRFNASPGGALLSRVSSSWSLRYRAAPSLIPVGAVVAMATPIGAVPTAAGVVATVIVEVGVATAGAAAIAAMVRQKRSRRQTKRLAKLGPQHKSALIPRGR